MTFYRLHFDPVRWVHQLFRHRIVSLSDSPLPIKNCSKQKKRFIFFPQKWPECRVSFSVLRSNRIGAVFGLFSVNVGPNSCRSWWTSFCRCCCCYEGLAENLKPLICNMKKKSKISIHNVFLGLISPFLLI